MRILAIETASEACSVALFDQTDHASRLIAHDHRILGRGHAEALVPMIAALPDNGRADRILVSLGPGSFTGVRIGIATARALGFAWDAQVCGYPTLALIAAMAQQRKQGYPVTICTNAGHGEWFVQNFDAQGLPEADVLSLSPDRAHGSQRHAHIAGNRASDLLGGTITSDTHANDLLPDAAAACIVPVALIREQLSPIYGRVPDATPQKAPKG